MMIIIGWKSDSVYLKEPYCAAVWEAYAKIESMERARKHCEKEYKLSVIRHFPDSADVGTAKGIVRQLVKEFTVSELN